MQPQLTDEQKKEQLMEMLFDHLGFNGVDGTYIYSLTRVKEAFHVGTMRIDDFHEIDGDFVAELADVTLEFFKPLLSQVEAMQKALEWYADDRNWSGGRLERIEYPEINVTLAEDDGGERARQTLQQVKGDT